MLHYIRKQLGGHHSNSDDERVDLQLKPLSGFCETNFFFKKRNTESLASLWTYFSSLGSKTHWAIVMDILISASLMKVWGGCALS